MTSLGSSLSHNDGYTCGICNQKFHHPSLVYSCNNSHIFCQKCYRCQYYKGSLIFINNFCFLYNLKLKKKAPCVHIVVVKATSTEWINKPKIFRNWAKKCFQIQKKYLKKSREKIIRFFTITQRRFHQKSLKKIKLNKTVLIKRFQTC